ncbi:hypothetical protein [Coleofasciculus sp. LEGE 07092]|uniref:hypothetical protein n=1 Tax=Coleofasciculus sp. LEGE 07092 TaxID=2777969 RepID=UPI001880B66E|nr:hypothetical protein [Coleofasciculus sp. LEGE 07092]MBE9150861.1 hypothetical protein [Coleofasciculus sp. LEGE 07092]
MSSSIGFLLIVNQYFYRFDGFWTTVKLGAMAIFPATMSVLLTSQERKTDGC